MKYINNIFTVEKSRLTKVIKKFETPIFCYSEKKINENKTFIEKKTIKDYYNF